MLYEVITEHNLEKYVTSTGIQPDVICRDLDEVHKLVCGEMN